MHLAQMNTFVSEAYAEEEGSVESGRLVWLSCPERRGRLTRVSG